MAIDQNVIRFDVTVHDALAMNLGQGRQELAQDRHGGRLAQRPSRPQLQWGSGRHRSHLFGRPNQLTQAAGVIRHDEIGRAIDQAGAFEDGDDVGMVEARDQIALSDKVLAQSFSKFRVALFYLPPQPATPDVEDLEGDPSFTNAAEKHLIARAFAETPQDRVFADFVHLLSQLRWNEPEMLCQFGSTRFSHSDLTAAVRPFDPVCLESVVRDRRAQRPR